MPATSPTSSPSSSGLPRRLADVAAHRLSEGAVVKLKISELPKFNGHTCWTGGAVAASPFCSACRYASIAGQSAAFLASFQTATPYVRVAAAYT
jgi:hypothetical protein